MFPQCIAFLYSLFFLATVFIVAWLSYNDLRHENNN
jgi:hypothetical protein